MVALICVQIYTVLQSWLVLDLTGSTLALGTLLMLTMVPRAVLLPVGGVLADRFHPRNLLIGTGYAFVLILTAVGVLLRTGEFALVHLMVVALAIGLVTAVYLPASTSILPALVEAEALQKANSANQAVLVLSMFVGPAVGGALLAAAGYWPTVAISAAACALCVAATHLLPGRMSGSRATEVRGAFRSVAEGFAVVRTSRVLQGCIALAALINLALLGPVQVGLPALAADRGLDTTGLGFLMASTGLGQTVGAVLGGIVGHRGRQVAWVMGLGVAVGALWAAVGWIQPTAGIMGVLVGNGVWTGILNVVVSTAIQVHSPPHLLGRVVSLQHVGMVGLQPVSVLASGWLSAQFGIPSLFQARGLLMVLMAVAGTVLLTREQVRADARSAG